MSGISELRRLTPPLAGPQDVRQRPAWHRATPSPAGRSIFLSSIFLSAIFLLLLFTLRAHGDSGAASGAHISRKLNRLGNSRRARLLLLRIAPGMIRNYTIGGFRLLKNS